jgi:hypothetical protein
MNYIFVIIYSIIICCIIALIGLAIYNEIYYKRKQKENDEYYAKMMEMVWNKK